MPSRGRDPLQDADSDQESVRNVASSNRYCSQAKVRRHTLPPILHEPERYAYDDGRNPSSVLRSRSVTRS